MNSKIITFLFLILFFTVIIFFTDTFFISKDKFIINPEEKYIEETLKSTHSDFEVLGKTLKIKNKKIKDKKVEDKKVEEKNKKIKKIILEKIKKQINFWFIPNSIKDEEENNKRDILKILNNNNFYIFLEKINILFFKNKSEVRWKMKSKQIKLFWPQYMDSDELISVFMHEFGHYVDLYYFKRENNQDISYKFYDISWDSTTIIKKWLNQKDFVSGYSMTNKYEDFAESLTYYILHNRDFLEKSINSDILRKKYNFFNLVLFKSEIFKNTDFSKNNKVKDYYRDITKIHFSRKNFLQYLKKSI